MVQNYNKYFYILQLNSCIIVDSFNIVSYSCYDAGSIIANGFIPHLATALNSGFPKHMILLFMKF